MKLHLLTFIMAALVLTSCSSTKNTPDMDTMDTAFTLIPPGTFWKLQTLQGKDYSNYKSNGKDIGFTFQNGENKINGFAGCNNFFGAYEVKLGNRIRFDAVGSTRMSCPDQTFNESEFLNVFFTADNFILNGDMLSLNLGKGAPLAVFKKVEKPNDGITEKYWKLKTLEGQDIKMGLNQEREIYFTLKTQDNQVTGFAGCNRISGTYKLEEGNRIRFSQMATTLMACPDVDFNEAEFLKVFELADNYTIVDDVLSLNVGRRAPLAVFEAVYF